MARTVAQSVFFMGKIVALYLLYHNIASSCESIEVILTINFFDGSFFLTGINIFQVKHEEIWPLGLFFTPTDRIFLQFGRIFLRQKLAPGHYFMGFIILFYTGNSMQLSVLTIIWLGGNLVYFSYFD